MTKRKDSTVQDTNTHLTENVATTADGDDQHSYVHIEDVKLGDTLVVMGDEYDCLHDGEEKEVKQNANGRLYVECEEGDHWLDKGVDIHDYVIGLGTKV